jgi:hypothetical protein
MRLTRDEILLIAAIITALLVGASVKHYRDSQRLHSQPPPLPAKTSTPIAEDRDSP